MPHPSAYDPDIDDHHELPDPTLTPDQLQALMTELRDKIVRSQQSQHQPSGGAGQAGTVCVNEVPPGHW